MTQIFPKLARLRSCLTLRAALYPILIWTGARQTCLGIEVVNLTAGEEDSAQYFAKVTSALEIIAQYQPKRLDRIRRDLRYILIFNRQAGCYWPDLRACVLSHDIITMDTERVALSIVHEATHARLWARGIPYDPPRRARVEGVCITQEVSLLHFLTNGPERAAARLALLETPWWTDEQLRERMIYSLNAYAPPWLVRLIIWLHPPP